MHGVFARGGARKPLAALLAVKPLEQHENQEVTSEDAESDEYS